MEQSDAARIRRRQLLAGSLAAGAVWVAPTVTQLAVASAQQSAVACAAEPSTCGAPFGGVSHLATVEGGLRVTYLWTAPVAGKSGQVAAWVLCCGAASHGGPVVRSVGVPSAGLTDSVLVDAATLDLHCGSDDSFVVRSALSWFSGGVLPLSVPGSAVVDVTLSRSGGVYTILDSRQRLDLPSVCYPLAP